MAVEFKKASRIFNKFLKFTLGNYLRHLFGFRIFKGQIAGLKPPYIVLANHTNFWDPFLLSMCFPEPVYFVTSDTHFRNPLLRILLSFVGAIPKTKNISDPKSIKSILKAINSKCIIGIFPEGRRSWDGKTLPLFYPTAKLIKSANLPVIAVLFKGAYLSMPRWARKTRKGELLMFCSKILDRDDIAVLSADEIFDRITIDLSHDEYEFQKTRMVRYKSALPAENLELFLFCCPGCKSIGSLKSENEAFYCTSCGYAVKYNEYGFFENTESTIFYDNPRDWNQWQLKHLEALVNSICTNNPFYEIFDDNDILLQTGTADILKPLKREQSGRLTMLCSSIRFEGMQGMLLDIPLVKITGENIQLNNQLEFYNDKILYKFSGNSGNLSAYKWVKTIELLKKLI